MNIFEPLGNLFAQLANISVPVLCIIFGVFLMFSGVIQEIRLDRFRTRTTIEKLPIILGIIIFTVGIVLHVFVELVPQISPDVPSLKQWICILFAAFLFFLGCVKKISWSPFVFRSRSNIQKAYVSLGACCLLVALVFELMNIPPNFLTRSEVEPIFYAYLEAWNQKDDERQISMLSPGFSSISRNRLTSEIYSNYDYSGFIEQKRRTFSRYRSISIKGRNVSFLPSSNQVELVEYCQYYNSSAYKSIGTNRIFFRREDNDIKIFKEEFELDARKIGNQRELISDRHCLPFFEEEYRGW